MKKTIYYTFFILLVFSGACQKNVLDKKPLSEISEDLVWKDANLAQLYVNDFYTKIPSSYERGLDMATEIAEAGVGWHDTQVYNRGDITPFNSPHSAEWGAMYENIRKANLFLEKYDTTQGSRENNNYLRGQVFFMRAYCYSELINLFGGVPVITSAQQLTDSLNVSRNTYEECVEQILKDYDEAAALLPQAWEGSDIGRATSGAALALKARQLLYAASPLHNENNDLQKWQRAADANLAVINLDRYSLYGDYGNLFLVDNNEEVIFDIQFQYPVRVNENDYRYNPQGINGAFGMGRPTQNFVDTYQMSSGLSIKDASSGYNPQDPYKNLDPRFYATINYNGAVWRGGNVETFADGANGPGVNDSYGTGAQMTGYYTRKFLNQSTPILYLDGRGNENWIIMRLGEVFLNYAETQIALGNEGEAKTYMNKIRTRAGMPDVPQILSGNALLQYYQRERTIELAFEESHFFDVRRWKTAPVVLSETVTKVTIIEDGNGNVNYTVADMEDRVWRDALYYIPIPQEEIDKNPSLIQNPGY